MLVKTFHTPDYPDCTLKIGSTSAVILEGEETLVQIHYPVCDGNWERKRQVAEAVLRVISEHYPETFDLPVSADEILHGEAVETEAPDWLRV